MTTTAVVLQDLTRLITIRGPPLASRLTTANTSTFPPLCDTSQKVADSIQQIHGVTANTAHSAPQVVTAPRSLPRIEDAPAAPRQDRSDPYETTKQLTCMVCAFHLFTTESMVTLSPETVSRSNACISDNTFGASHPVGPPLCNINKDSPTLDVDCACDFTRARWDSCTDLNGEEAVKSLFRTGDQNHLGSNAVTVLYEYDGKIVQVPNTSRLPTPSKEFVKTPIFYRQKYPVLSLAITSEHQDVKISRESLSQPNPFLAEDMRKEFAHRNAEWDAFSQRRLRDQISCSPEDDEEETFGHDSAPASSLLAADTELAKFWANKKIHAASKHLELRWRARRRLGLLYGPDDKLVKLDDNVLNAYRIREERALAAWIVNRRKLEANEAFYKLSKAESNSIAAERKPRWDIH